MIGVLGMALLANFLVVKSPVNLIVDSFIRDDVKPADFERLTLSAKSGKSHLSGQASAFFITEDGYLLTNHHVVDGAMELVIVFKGTAYRAEVVAKNRNRDVALLKVNLMPRIVDGVYKAGGRPKVPYLESESTVSVGQSVYAIGYPETDTLGYETKVTKGIVSSLSGYKGDKNMFQMDAMITHGNSGGPVVNEYGLVVGIAQGGVFGISDNCNYAVNMESVRKAVQSTFSWVEGIHGRRPSVEKMIAKVKESVVLVLRYAEGPCERIRATTVSPEDSRQRERDTLLRKGIVAAKMCKLRKDWKSLKEVTDGLIQAGQASSEVQEMNDLAREELGLHLMIFAEADGKDVHAVIHPICGFKESFVEYGKPVPLCGGRQTKGFPVEAKLTYEDDEWEWTGDLKTVYDWRGTKELRITMKRTGKK